mgnify:FL=1
MKNIQIGESVVLKGTLQQGKVVDAADDERGLAEHVKVEFKDGSSNWVPNDNITKMLVEVDPKTNKTFLAE